MGTSASLLHENPLPLVDVTLEEDVVLLEEEEEAVMLEEKEVLPLEVDLPAGSWIEKRNLSNEQEYMV